MEQRDDLTGQMGGCHRAGGEGVTKRREGGFDGWRGRTGGKKN